MAPKFATISALCAAKKVSAIHATPKQTITPTTPPLKTPDFATAAGLTLQMNMIKQAAPIARISMTCATVIVTVLPFTTQLGMSSLKEPNIKMPSTERPKSTTAIFASFVGTYSLELFEATAISPVFTRR